MSIGAFRSSVVTLVIPGPDTGSLHLSDQKWFLSWGKMGQRSVTASHEPKRIIIPSFKGRCVIRWNKWTKPWGKMGQSPGARAMSQRGQCQADGGESRRAHVPHCYDAWWVIRWNKWKEYTFALLIIDIYIYMHIYALTWLSLDVFIHCWTVVFISVVDGITGQIAPAHQAAPAAAAAATTTIPPGGLVEWHGQDNPWRVVEGVWIGVLFW